jgi:molybdopterin-guanine dinucleotide biosynthesis protein A
MTQSISAVILAGGANSRFNGVTKAKIIISGKSIISRIFTTIGDIFEEIILVTNTPQEFAEYSNYTITGDQILNAGPLGGIHAAIKTASGEAFFVFAGDMPLLSKSLILKQIEYFHKNKCDVLIPRIGENIEPLHAIYNRSVLNPLEEYLVRHDDYAVRDFFRMVRAKYFEPEASEEIKTAFTNINVPGDIILVEKILSDK